MSKSAGRTDWKVAPSITTTGELDANPGAKVYSGDGAITIKTHLALLTKGTAGAYTLAAPTTAQNGTRLDIVSSTASAHVITAPASTYNGTNNTATFGAAIGNGVTLIAKDGKWYSRGATNVTFSTV